MIKKFKYIIVFIMLGVPSHQLLSMNQGNLRTTQFPTGGIRESLFGLKLLTQTTPASALLQQNDRSQWSFLNSTRDRAGFSSFEGSRFDKAVSEDDEPVSQSTTQDQSEDESEVYEGAVASRSRSSSQGSIDSWISQEDEQEKIKKPVGGNDDIQAPKESFYDAVTQFPNRHPGLYTTGKYAFGLSALAAGYKFSPLSALVANRFQQASPSGQFAMYAAGFAGAGVMGKYVVHQIIDSMNAQRAVKNFKADNPRIVTVLQDATVASLIGASWLLGEHVGCLPPMIPTLRDICAEYPPLTGFVLGSLALKEIHRVWASGVFEGRRRSLNNALIAGTSSAGKILLAAFAANKALQLTGGLDRLGFLSGNVFKVCSQLTAAGFVGKQMYDAFNEVSGKQFGKDSATCLVKAPGLDCCLVVKSDGSVEPIDTPRFEQDSIHERWYNKITSDVPGTTYQSFEDFVWEELRLQNLVEVSKKIIKFSQDGQKLVIVEESFYNDCWIKFLVLSDDKKEYVARETVSEKLTFDKIKNVFCDNHGKICLQVEDELQSILITYEEELKIRQEKIIEKVGRYFAHPESNKFMFVYDEKGAAVYEAIDTLNTTDVGLEISYRVIPETVCPVKNGFVFIDSQGDICHCYDGALIKHYNSGGARVKSAVVYKGYYVTLEEDLEMGCDRIMYRSLSDIA